MLKLVLKLKAVLFLLASDFPTENPSKQKRTILIPNVVSNMRKTLSILILLLIFSCAQRKYKTIDFGQFEITVPENWNEYERKGIDSYVGGITTDTNDSLKFDFGRYSADLSTQDLPMVYDLSLIHI